MNKKYFIVAGRAFRTLEFAKEYCKVGGIDETTIITTRVVSEKYYELQTTSNYKIFYNTYLTEEEINSPKWVEYIAQLQSGEYSEQLYHIKEISEKDYIKYKGA